MLDGQGEGVNEPGTAALIALDTETHMFQPGLLAPPVVIGSFATSERNGLILKEGLKPFIIEEYKQGRTLVGANIAYDFGVIAAEWPELLPTIFQLHEEGRVFDILIAQALHAIAEGNLFKNPITGAPLQNPYTKKQTEKYSLELCSQFVLGRFNAKENDYYATRYAILEKIPLNEWPEEARQYPVDDSQNTLDVAVEQMKGHKNLHDMTAQTRAAWALHLAAVWGIRTDPVQIAKVENRCLAEREAHLAEFQKVGLIRADGTEDSRAVKTRVAVAYGATGKCPRCEGNGKVLSPISGKPIICKAGDGGCDGTGLDLNTAPGLPRADKGGIAKDRDTQEESDDPILEAYSEVSKTEKILDTYIPYVKEGVTIPITLRPNVLKETGRTSYSGVIQLLPRKGGIRECFVARDGRVLCSIDYNGGELSTHAQVCYWAFGASDLRDAINADKDPHSMLAARMVGMDYETLRARYKAGDKEAEDVRFTAKAGNFGFGGGMGAAKFVLTQRRQNDLRFCIKLRTAPRCACGGDPTCRKCRGRGALCGVKKVHEYKRRQIPPTCAECIGLSEGLRESWFETWREMREYFPWITHIADNIGWVEQFVSHRIRGGVEFTSAANGFFQALLADGAKHALWKVSQECYTDRNSPMFGARPIIFAHDEIISELIEGPGMHEAAYRMRDVMVDSIREYVPDVKIGADPALMRRWYKGVVTAFDDQKRLKVWEPEVNHA